MDVEGQGVVVVEGGADADEVDEADCLLVKVDEMDDVGNNQGFRPRHVVEAFKVLILVRGVIIKFAYVENVE